MATHSIQTSTGSRILETGTIHKIRSNTSLDKVADAAQHNGHDDVIIATKDSLYVSSLPRLPFLAKREGIAEGMTVKFDNQEGKIVHVDNEKARSCRLHVLQDAAVGSVVGLAATLLNMRLANYLNTVKIGIIGGALVGGLDCLAGEGQAPPDLNKLKAVAEPE